MSNALNQLNLPFNMILSAILLSTRYKRSHYMGAVLVLYGALVTMIPVFRNEVAANMPDPSMFWILFYIIGLLPAAGSNDFPNYISQAHNCFIGNPATFNGKELPCNNGVFVTFMWYILFNCVYNQEGSSVLFVVSSAVCLPLTDILYMVPFIAGPKASQTFTIYDGFALFVLIMGMLVYHSEKEERVEAATSTQKSPMFSSPSLRQAQLMRGRRKSGRVGGSALALRAPTVKYGTVKDSGNVV
ncbi:hypothetical protein DYB32_000958 [Aphanomyces invadans]|uniref:Uncharacterized protein n=1 Tax=Aphanomyces invadans TaxID=157072 RepID=A0A3R6YFP8_9STRA|nr:hypothetical protein DYB32_000958 [Aphanomyces invadans]